MAANPFSKASVRNYRCGKPGKVEDFYVVYFDPVWQKSGFQKMTGTYKQARLLYATVAMGGMTNLDILRKGEFELWQKSQVTDEIENDLKLTATQSLAGTNRKEYA